MIRKRHITAYLATMLAIPAFVSAVSPYTQAKFQNAIAASKLQYPLSSGGEDNASLVGGFDAPTYYTLEDTDKMAFTHDTVDERCELRNLNNWNVNTTVQTASANVAVQSQAGEQVTILQIHDDANAGIGTGPNKPLLRIYRLNSDGHAWAVIKDDATGATNLPHVDLGVMTLGSYYDCDITVDNGTLTVNFDNAGTAQVNAIDVSYWNFPSYWKAGVYLQNSGASTVRFNELTWPGAKTIVDDSFADTDRANTGALQADWWSSSSSSGNSVEVDGDGLGLVSGTSGRGLHGTFTPQTLEIGETLKATLTFETPATVANSDGLGTAVNGGLKVALVDYNDAGLANDLVSSSSSVNSLYTSLPGYYADFDINRADAGDDIQIYEHNTPNATGRFLGTSGEWTSLGSSANADYAFAASTEYEVIVSVTRTGADTMDINGTLSSADGTVLDNFSTEDVSGIANHFGMLGVWAGANSFGSTTASDPDNGITITNATVELVNLTVNQAPAFTFDPIDGDNATQDAAYTGSLAASDLEGDAMTFTKSSGPAWLTVATDGTLGGTPLVGDLGANVFVVQVADAGGSNTATLNITVDAPTSGATTIVNDNFTDVDRTATGSPDALDANWWSSSSSGGTGIEIDANGLGLATGTSGRGLHGTFSPQTLDINGTLTATLTFTTPATVGTAKNDALKFAIMDLNNAGLEADLTSSSSSVNPLYTNLPGYLIQFDVNGTSANTNIREHVTPNTSGRFLGTSGEWSSMGSSSTSSPLYTFAAATEYVVVITVTRTGADTMDIFGSLSQGGSLLDSHTVTDASGIANHFGMLGAWVNSNTFGSTSSSGVGVDNGITFTNVTITSEGTLTSNQAPAFSTDPINEINGLQDVAYSSSIADNASDLEADTMTFSKASGPSWLTVASNGDLSGTPLVGDLGLNVFTVQVDATGGSDTATLNITVDAPFTGGTLVDDNFADVDRTKTGTPDLLDTNWWGSSGTSAIEIDGTGLGLRSGTSGRGLHGTFAPQTLAIGDAMTATLTFTTPATVGTDRDGALKFALMDLNDGGLAADLTSSSSSPNPLYVGQPGYMIDFDVNNVGNILTKGDDNIVIREHDLLDTQGRFLGTSSEWDELSASADDAGGFTILASTSYVVVLKVTRTNTGSLDIFASLSLDGGATLATHTGSDIDGTIANNFGMLGAWVNSNTFGSTNSSGVPDNGITFTNIKVETALDVSGNTAPTATDNSGSIGEDALVGDDVLTVAATDDGSISSYEIIAGNTDDAFSIDSSGLIEVAGALDAVTTPSYTLTVQVTDNGTPGLKDTATVTITVTEAVASPFAGWAATKGLTGGNNGPTDNPDGDDADNLAEYFFWDSDPLTAEVFGDELTGIALSGGDLVFTHDRPQDTSDVVVTYEWSTDLSTWTDSGVANGGTTVTLTAGATGAPANGNGTDYESVTVTAVVSGTAPTKIFARVAVTPAP